MERAGTPLPRAASNRLMRRTLRARYSREKKDVDRTLAELCTCLHCHVPYTVANATDEILEGVRVVDAFLEG